MDRMAQHTNQPEVLREVFAALGNDPFVIAECLARPVLAGAFAQEKCHDRLSRTSWTPGEGARKTRKAKPVAAVNGKLYPSHHIDRPKRMR